VAAHAQRIGSLPDAVEALEPELLAPLTQMQAGASA
jgi:hypothetical protein